MPFTLSHPAIVLPLMYVQKKYVSVTALLAGSVVPDFEYFLRMQKDKSHYSHTGWGIFWFDIPFGLFLCFVFHAMVRKPLIVHLPAFLQKRFISSIDFKWGAHFKNYWHIILLSLFAGTILHIGWDAGVHKASHFFTTTNYFQTMNNNNKFSDLQVYYAVWLIHSLLGVLALIVGVIKLKSHKDKIVHSKVSGYWLHILVICCAISAFRIWQNRFLSWEDVIVTITSAFIISLLITSIRFSKTSY